MAATGPRAYRFDPLDHTGIFLGLTAGPCIVLGAAIAAAVAAMTAGVPVVVAAVPPVAVAVIVGPRPGGRSLWERCPSPIAWCRTLPRQEPWLATLPPAHAWRELPPVLARLAAGAAPAAVTNRRERTATVVLRVFGPRLVLRGPDDHDLGLGLWADALNQLAAEPAVAHVAWSDHLTTATPSATTGPGRMALVGDLVERAAHHEALLTITLRSTADEAVVGRVTAGACRALAAAGIAADPPLGADEVARLVARRGDPFHPTGAILAVRGEWDRCRVDGAVHRTYWVASWPQVPVTAGWLDSFIAQAGVTRTLAVAMVPEGRHQARRRIERDLVKLESDATTRTDRGRRVDARHRRATQTLLEREQELVEGHAEYAFVGLVTVSGPDDATLDAACHTVEQAAIEAGLELRALHGRHDHGWAATLPVGLLPRMVAA
jgi:hypothetical protein